MKNIWKNVLGVALIAAISSGAAIGTSTYLMNKNQRPAELAYHILGYENRNKFISIMNCNSMAYEIRRNH